jgi:hypothetical protein
MNDYREPLATSSSTEIVELTLSTDAVDVGEVYLTIMPVLGGITFYMHYYPRMSFIVGVSVIMGIQISIFVMFTILSTVVRYLASLSSYLADDRQDMDMDLEGEYVQQNRQQDDDDDDQGEDDDGRAVRNDNRGAVGGDVGVAGVGAAVAGGGRSHSADQDDGDALAGTWRRAQGGDDSASEGEAPPQSTMSGTGLLRRRPSASPRE